MKRVGRNRRHKEHGEKQGGRAGLTTSSKVFTEQESSPQGGTTKQKKHAKKPLVFKSEQAKESIRGCNTYSFSYNSREKENTT